MSEKITDPEFDLNRTEEYKLSIQVSLDGFSFSVCSLKENKLLALQNKPVTVSSPHFLARRFEDWINEIVLLKKKYAELQLNFFAPGISLIPSAFYDYHTQNSVAELLFGDQKNYSVTDNYLPKVPGNLIFSIPDSLLLTFQNYFPNHKINHPVSIVDRYLREHDPGKKNKLGLYFGKKTFCLMFYTDNKIEVVNSFDYQHPNDVIFYSISVLQQLKISSKKVFLFLGGEILKGGELHNKLINYFNNIFFLTSGLNQFPEKFRNNEHRFITLF